MSQGVVMFCFWYSIMYKIAQATPYAATLAVTLPYRVFFLYSKNTT